MPAYMALVYLAKKEEDFKLLEKFELKKLDQTVTVIDKSQDLVDLKNENFAFSSSRFPIEDLGKKVSTYLIFLILD